MSLEDLFTLACGGLESRLGLEMMRGKMSDDMRRGLAEILVGRCMVHLGQAVGGAGNVSVSAVDLLRRRALADALKEVIELCAVYGVGSEELSAMLGPREG